MVDFVSTPQKFFSVAAREANRPAYFVRGDEVWRPTSWDGYASEVREVARALIARGVQHGDVVAILGFNRPEWSIMAMAAMSVGAAVAGIYWTCAAVEVAHVVRHSRARVLLVEDAAQYAKIAAHRPQLPALCEVVAMRGPPVPDTTAWQDFRLAGPALEDELERRIAALRADDLGSLIYTSGTTGPAKAVMLSHGSLSWVRQTLSAAYGVTPNDRLLSYLPMAHIAEQMGAIHNQAESGFALYYARAIEQLGDHLKEVRPTLFFGVPRIWEKMHAAIDGKLEAASPLRRALVNWAFSAARQWHAATLAGQRVSWWRGFTYRLSARLVLRRLKALLGLDQARLLLTGASPIGTQHLWFFAGLDLVVREVYGASEACGPITLSSEGRTRFGAVGPAIPGLELRIVDDEVQVRGPSVFRGYLDAPQETAAALREGWLATGDLGRIDADGLLELTGRKKDLIITAGGKNIAPANLEAELMALPLIEHAVVCGNDRPYLLALLTLKADALAAFADEHGLTLGEARTAPRLLETLREGVDAVNRQHARVETIRRFSVLPRPLSIASGELTPTMKVRRQIVIERHADLIERLYAEAKSAPCASFAGVDD
jgi:long-chain acyl-CoA synthetase